MKHLRRQSAFLVAGLLACFSLVSIGSRVAVAQGPSLSIEGASYVITNVDSTGAFASRGVVTLHSDSTLSAIDSGQGGPTYYFSSQLGSWRVKEDGSVVGRTVDFDFSPDNETARLDYTFKFEANGMISGTIVLTYFPQTADPQGSGGTFGGTFTFTGSRIKP